MKCRGCYSGKTSMLLDLGYTPISNDFLELSQLDCAEAYYPLKVRVCDACGMVQLPEVTQKESLFSENYVYFSSYSSSWLKHSAVFVSKMITDFRIDKNDLVIEIASNDGYLLQFFQAEGINVLGIEPAKSVAQVAKSKGVETLIEFFGADLARELKSKKISPKLIVANNVLAHVPDIHDFIQGVSILLDSTGFATFEFPHLSNLIELNQFDTIYHEHYSYLSLEALKPIFVKHGLEIFQVETLNTHGGSLRIFVASKGSRKINEKEINDIEVRELTWNPRSPRILQSLRSRALETKFNLLNELISLKKAGLTVAGYGAAAKGNTLLNYCGIDSDLISYVVDKNPIKQGKYLPGAHIPVYSESAFKTTPPDVVIIFPWNLKEEIKNQLEGQLGPSVKFMVTTPEVEFI